MCFVFDEVKEVFLPWGLDSQLLLTQVATLPAIRFCLRPHHFFLSVRPLPARPRYLPHPRQAHGSPAGNPLRRMRRRVLREPAGRATAPGSVLPRARLPVERRHLQRVQQLVRQRGREEKHHLHLQVAVSGRGLPLLEPLEASRGGSLRQPLPVLLRVGGRCLQRVSHWLWTRLPASLGLMPEERWYHCRA